MDVLFVFDGHFAFTTKELAAAAIGFDDQITVHKDT